MRTTRGGMWRKTTTKEHPPDEIDLRARKASATIWWRWSLRIWRGRVCPDPWTLRKKNDPEEPDPAKRQKIYAFLARKGFSYDAINSAMKQWE